MNIISYAIFNVNVGLAYRFLTSSARVTTDPNDRLINSHIVKIKNVPYHVLVVYKNLYCSGSLITSKIVVTAATCLHKYSGNAVVKLGSDTITGFGQIIPVQDVKIHEYFRHKSDLDNDIALMVLKSNVVFGKTIEKVLLIEPDTALYEGSSLFASGWGGNDLPRRYTNLLLRTEMVVMAKLDCQDIHGVLITESNFCASFNYDHRLTDNGGGATFNNVLVGILSYAPTNYEEASVAIFTNVSHFHRWLRINSIRLLHKFCHTNTSDADSLETNEYT